MNKRFAVFCIHVSINRFILLIVCSYSNFRQTTAIPERPVANACHAVGNYNFRQTTARSERTIANACHAVGNYNFRQTTTPKERIIANACHRQAVVCCRDYHFRSRPVITRYSIIIAAVFKYQPFGVIIFIAYIRVTTRVSVGVNITAVRVPTQITFIVFIFRRAVVWFGIRIKT